MATRGRPATFKVEDFSKGLNTRYANTEIEASESPDLQNVKFDNKGELEKRNGFAKTTTGGLGSTAAVTDQFLYIKNNADQLHMAGSALDVYKRTSPSGTAWSSIKTVAANPIGDSTTQFDITNPSGNIFRYTWDATGTDPVIGDNVVAGKSIIINAQNFNAANNVTATVKNVGTTYFEIENASGVAEVNVTIGTGSITIPSTGERWQFLEIDDLLYAGNGINDWFKFDGETVTDVSTIPHGNIAIHWHQRLWVVNATNPSQVSWSKTNAALGDVEDYTDADSGFAVFGKDDGQKITGLKILGGSLGNTLIVFKERSIYTLTFTDFSTTDGGYSQDIADEYYGNVSRDACINVENDIFFFTGSEVRRIGFDANFNGIRTNPVSLNIQDQLQTLNDKTNTRMIFHDDILHLAVSKTTANAETVYTLDTRYSGWSKWISANTNFKINSWLSDRVNDVLYFGSKADDQVYQFNDGFADDTTAISAYWFSKRFDLDAPHLYKRYRWLYVTSRNLDQGASGDLCYEINVLDNAAIRKTKEACFPSSQLTPEGIWAAAQYDITLWGGGDDDFEDPGFLYNRITLNEKGISIQYKFKNDIIDEDLSLQSLTLVYTGKDLHHYSGDYTR